MFDGYIHEVKTARWKLQFSGVQSTRTTHIPNEGNCLNFLWFNLNYIMYYNVMIMWLYLHLIWLTTFFCWSVVNNWQQLAQLMAGHELWHDIPQGNLSLFSSRKGQLIWIVFQKLVCFHSFYDLFLRVFNMFVEILAFQRHLPRLSYPPFLNLRYSEIFGVLVVKIQSVVTLTLITSDLQPIFSRNR